MTIEQLYKLSFDLIGSRTSEKEDSLLYANSKYGIQKMVIINKKEGGLFGKPKRYYIYNGKSYNNVNTFLDAIKDIKPIKTL